MLCGLGGANSARRRANESAVCVCVCSCTYLLFYLHVRGANDPVIRHEWSKYMLRLFVSVYCISTSKAFIIGISIVSNDSSDDDLTMSITIIIRAHMEYSARWSWYFSPPNTIANVNVIFLASLLPFSNCVRDKSRRSYINSQLNYRLSISTKTCFDAGDETMTLLFACVGSFHWYAQIAP